MIDLRKQVEICWKWLDERLGLEQMGELAKKKDVPVHKHTIWYYLGGMTLFLFAIQISTGILLLFYYRPSAGEAFESIQFLMAEVEFGWLFRSIHSWASNLLIFTLFLHLFSVLFLKAYRPPRELTWLTGAALMGVALAFGFTGYLLPWNTLAYFATRVGTEITGVLPLVGDRVACHDHCHSWCASIPRSKTRHERSTGHRERGGIESHHQVCSQLSHS
jgi:cytochrome b6